MSEPFGACQLVKSSSINYWWEVYVIRRRTIRRYEQCTEWYNIFCSKVRIEHCISLPCTFLMEKVINIAKLWELDWKEIDNLYLCYSDSSIYPKYPCLILDIAAWVWTLWAKIMGKFHNLAEFDTWTRTCARHQYLSPNNIDRRP